MEELQKQAVSQNHKDTGVSLDSRHFFMPSDKGLQSLKITNSSILLIKNIIPVFPHNSTSM